MNNSVLTGVTSARLDSCLVRNPPLTGSFVEVTSLGGGSGSGSYDDADVRALIGVAQGGVNANASSLTAKADLNAVYLRGAVDTALQLKADESSVYTKSAVDSALLLKEPVIQDGGLSTAKISGLGYLLGDLQMQIISNLGDRYSKAETNGLLADKVTQSELTSGLGTRQPTIGDGHLQISHTSTLQYR
jgi:hypothetical protein